MSADPNANTWKYKAEFYEKEYHKLKNELLKFKKRIDDLELESGWLNQ